MASKYAAVIDKLPKSFNTDSTPGYQDKVNDEKKRLIVDTEPSAAGLAAMYVAVRAEEDDLDEQLSAVHLRKTAIEQMLADQFEAEGTTSMRLASGHSVSVQLEPYTRVVDKDANRLWAIEQGLERQLTLPWQTLNSLAKERLLAGEEPPAGTELSARTKLVLRKA